ncbi:MAG: ABC transporter permease [Actinobacteria bacterium]|nr:ABC transporter permease [Actinomycetota bacterium]
MSVLARSRSAATALLPFALVLVVGVLLLISVSAPPLEVFRLIFQGALGSQAGLSTTLMVWVPLVLAAAGLVVTFTAGLWNIGIEGQIIVGAVAGALVARTVIGPPLLVIPLLILAGAVGGMLWGLLVGVLRVYGRVNEIFGGLGLFFVATGLVVYLVIGPWQRAGSASTSGTDLFRREAWLPRAGGWRFSWVALGLAVALVVGVYLLMRGTRFGLRLRAVGRNGRSAFLMGITTNRHLLAAFALCGALGGLGGALHAAGFHHKLVPAVSGGYGFLGILVVLLAGFRAVWIAPIAFFFAVISVGSTQLQLRLQLHSSLAGVLQGVLVLCALLVGGWQLRRAHLSRRRAEEGG